MSVGECGLYLGGKTQHTGVEIESWRFPPRSDLCVHKRIVLEVQETANGGPHQGYVNHFKQITPTLLPSCAHLGRKINNKCVGGR